MRPLQGVFDCAKVPAGPFCTRPSDLEAEIIKVEPLPGEDDARRRSPIHGAFSPIFLCVNRDKKSIALGNIHGGVSGDGRRAVEQRRRSPGRGMMRMTGEGGLVRSPISPIDQATRMHPMSGSAVVAAA
jgi:CoA-transferase family III